MHTIIQKNGRPRRSPKSVFILFAIMAMTFYTTHAQSPPPFSPGTIWFWPDIVTPDDPTTFQSITYTGRGQRVVWDRRFDSRITINGYLFQIRFSDGLSAEAIVNPEFGSVQSASFEADKYAKLVGQLPTDLRRDVNEIWIHKGVHPFGGGNNALQIHTGQSTIYEARGVLEETLIHEAAHTSLDSRHANAGGWISAQNADGTFISPYAKDHPRREDVAETFLTYFAVRFRGDRIPQADFDKIVQTVPNRIRYFDAQSLNMYPVVGNTVVGGTAAVEFPPPGDILAGTTTTFRWNRPAGATAFDLYMGTSAPGATDIRASSVFNATELTISGLPNDGRTLYVRLWTFSADKWTFTDHTYRAATVSQPGGGADMQFPPPGDILGATRETFRWNRPNGATAFDLYIGTTGPGSTDIRASSVFNATEFTVSGLPGDGRTLFVRLWTWNNGQWHSKDYTYTATRAIGLQAFLPPKAVDASQDKKRLFNFPNPFQDTTSIQFKTQDVLGERVDVSVYDLNGRKVCGLLSKAVLEGTEHNIRWNGQDDQGRPLPEGHYIIMAKSNKGLNATTIAILAR